MPSGVLGANPQGEFADIDESFYGKTSIRGILDIGLLEVDAKYLINNDPEIEILGASSDMLIINLGANQKGLKVVDTVIFRLKYIGALALMNSSYIEKAVV